MEDAGFDCECEEDIRHYLHNLDFFAGVADKMKHIALTKSEVLTLFDRWMDAYTNNYAHNDYDRDDNQNDSEPYNPFMDMIRGFMEDAADSVKINLTDLKDPNFTFNMEPSDLDEDDDDQ